MCPACQQHVASSLKASHSSRWASLAAEGTGKAVSALPRDLGQGPPQVCSHTPLATAASQEAGRCPERDRAAGAAQHEPVESAGEE